MGASAQLREVPMDNRRATERVGFEPTEGLVALQLISSELQSTNSATSPENQKTKTSAFK